MLRSSKHFQLILVLMATMLSATVSAAPKRVVSINLCTDELAIMLARPGQLKSVYYITRDRYHSVLAKSARSLHSNRGTAEEMVGLAPDLILGNQYNKAYARVLMQKLGFRLLVLPTANTIEQLYVNIDTVARALGNTRQGQAVKAGILDAIRRHRKDLTPGSPTVLVYHPGGWIQKPPSLLHQVIRLAGMKHLQLESVKQSWTRVNFESIIKLRPDFLVVLDSGQPARSLSRLQLQHPVLQNYARRQRLIRIPDYWVNCGNPAFVRALEKISVATRQWQKRNGSN